MKSLHYENETQSSHLAFPYPLSGDAKTTFKLVQQSRQKIEIDKVLILWEKAEFWDLIFGVFSHQKQATKLFCPLSFGSGIENRYN